MAELKQSPKNADRAMQRLAETVLASREKPYLMAHRGNRKHCPENTLAAFRRALEEGADILETDLHLTCDGVFVCIHDATVDRTTDGTGAVADYSLEDLKQLSAGAGWKGFEDERIPTLAELAAILPADVVLALELKTDVFLEPDVCRRLQDELAQSGVDDRTMVISFSIERLRAVKRAAPGMLTGLISLSSLWPDSEPEFVGVFWPWLFLNPLFVRIAQRRGQFFCPLDPLPDGRLWWYRLLGCDSILSDDVGTTLAKLRRKG